MYQHSALTSLGDSHPLATACDQKPGGGNGLGARLVLSRLVLSWSHSETTVVVLEFIESLAKILSEEL